MDEDTTAPETGGEQGAGEPEQPLSESDRTAEGHFTPGHAIGLATRFQPGHSGNPKGRPRGVQKEVQEFLREHLPDQPDKTFLRGLIENLARTAAKGGSPGVAATRELLDRGYGRVPLALKMTDGGEDAMEGEIIEMRVVGESKTPRARALKEKSGDGDQELPE